MSQFGVLQQDYDAVLFLEDSKVVKEMLYSEFEAVLDGVVGEPEYAGQNCHAVYLQLDKLLQIKAAVFFTIEFSKDGTADKYWDLPLRQIGETATIEDGQLRKDVRIACSSQCTMPWYKDYFWEPDLSATSGLFSSLERCIRKNTLGFVVDKTAMQASVNNDPKESSSPSDSSQLAEHLDSSEIGDLKELLQYDSDERIKFARSLKKLRLQMSNLKQIHQQNIEEERKQWQEEKTALLRESHVAVKALEQADIKYKQLSSRLEDTEKRQDDLLSNDARSADKEKVLDQKNAQLKEQLEMREMEVYYRDQKIEAMAEELDEARNSKTGMFSDDNVLSTLSDQGVHFVLSLPAVGPISISMDHIQEFISDPASYLAERLKMDKALFDEWYQHAQHPRCQCTESDGSLCGAPTNVAMPHEFISGVSDQCEMHKFRVTIRKKA